MKVLILGSDGLIGRPLTEYLRLSNEVVEFDNYSNPVTDLRVPAILDNVLSEIDFVFFLAFDVGGSVYLKKYQDTYEFISNNIKIMNNTFDSSGTKWHPVYFCIKSDVRHDSFILWTSEVYRREVYTLSEWEDSQIMECLRERRIFNQISCHN